MRALRAKRCGVTRVPGPVRPRKRHLCVLAVAIVGVMAWSVAPAVSLQPYAPSASDFEQRVPDVERVVSEKVAAAARRDVAAARAGGEHVDDGPVLYRSPVIDAPGRFDLAGIGGELRPLEFRARTDGGTWSRWIEAANGDPVYFGGADQLQVRSRGVRPQGRLHYVNVSGSRTAAERLVNGARGAINSALISLASVASAEAVPDQPEIVRRGAWGANRKDGGCRPRTDPAYGTVKAAVIHHTVTGNSYSADEAPGIVLGICRYHRNGNGWNDIGYNFLVDRFGTVYEGRDGGPRRPVVGAHAQGYNSQTTGIASIGTHTSAKITDAARDAFVRVIAWKLALHGTKARGRTRLRSQGGSVNKYRSGKKVRVKRVLGHRRVNYTECPGKKLKQELGQLSRRAQKRIDSNGGPEPTAPQPQPN